MTTATAARSSNGRATQQSPRIRLDFLDGLRGLAALYVVFFHDYSQVNYHWGGGGLPFRVWHAAQWMVYGHYAVAVFIVLSGYCLMLPVARSSDATLAGGVRGFFHRRAMRIWPPYYAAVAFSLLLIALFSRWQPAQPTELTDMTPAFTAGSLLSHLFLVHNLSNAWIFKIDTPLWSVGMEWQIYFFFPLLLLPLWRRFGVAAPVAAAFAIGLAPHYLIHHGNNLDKTCPWYLGLFGIGMAAAVITFSRQYRGSRLWSHLPWGVIAMALTGVFFATDRIRVLRRLAWFLHTGQNTWTSDVLIGLAAASLILYCAQRSESADVMGQRPPVLRLLESRFAVALGGFSYSLYLIHDPLLTFLHLAMLRLHFSPTASLLALTVIGTPLCVAAAYLFHLAFERPFMNRSQRPPQ